jgi:hypothetical protein
LTQPPKFGKKITGPVSALKQSSIGKRDLLKNKITRPGQKREQTLSPKFNHKDIVVNGFLKQPNFPYPLICFDEVGEIDGVN